MSRGSKPGERRGGRKPGVPNKRTAETIAKASASGLTPLDYMLSVLRDPEARREERMDAASKAAPYVHARLSAVDHSAHMRIEPVISETDVRARFLELVRRAAAARNPGGDPSTH